MGYFYLRVEKVDGGDINMGKVEKGRKVIRECIITGAVVIIFLIFSSTYTYSAEIISIDNNTKVIVDKAKKLEITSFSGSNAYLKYDDGIRIEGNKNNPILNYVHRYDTAEYNSPYFYWNTDAVWASPNAYNGTLLFNLSSGGFWRVRIKTVVEVHVGDMGGTQYEGMYSGQTNYTVYSDWFYFSTAPKVKKIKIKKNKLTVKWDKIKGTTRYVVLVSNKKNKGYKAVGVTKKKSITIKKYKGKKFNKNKKYYISVVAVKTVKGKNYLSQVSLYTYK